MNYRRALKISTDAGLYVFIASLGGVSLWTVDEVLGWNLLPDWIDKYAQVLVIVLAIMAAFSVVISIMCSFAVMAESAAENAGITTPPTSPKLRRIVLATLLGVFFLMLGLNQINQFRAKKQNELERIERSAQFNKATDALQARMNTVVELFSGRFHPFLKTGSTSLSDAEEIQELLTAIHFSTPFEPEVRLLVRAQPPYQYSVVSVVREMDNNRQARRLDRQFLTTLPTEWEQKAVESLFKGEKVTIPADRDGAFIETDQPAAWGLIKERDTVIGVIFLKATRWER